MIYNNIINQKMNRILKINNTRNFKANYFL